MEIRDRLGLTLTDEDAKILRRGGLAVEFRLLRKKADFTLQEASDALRKQGDPLSTAMLSLFERSLKELRPATLERLEKIYGVPSEKSKASAEERAEVMRGALVARLPWMRTATVEPRAKSAKARENQQLRRENAELRFRAESAEFQLKKRDELLQYMLKLYQESQAGPKEKRNPFYGE
jgi:hypothetical protein